MKRKGFEVKIKFKGYPDEPKGSQVEVKVHRATPMQVASALLSVINTIYCDYKEKKTDKNEELFEGLFADLTNAELFKEVIKSSVGDDFVFLTPEEQEKELEKKHKRILKTVFGTLEEYPEEEEKKEGEEYGN